MRNQGIVGKEFICEQDIVNIWQRHDLRTVLHHADYRWRSAQTRLVRDHYLKSLSITVWVNATDSFWKLFESLRSQPNAKTDDDLPFEASDVQRLDQDAKHDFLETQAIFSPVRIIEKTERQILESVPIQRRLPFTEVTPIGCGSYGNVKRVVIPASYFVDKEGRYWKDVRTTTCF